jgi:hypothetical protein
VGLIDFMVGANFRDDKAGRVVVFPGDRPGRGYVVKSEAEESRIRAFMKMFYFAHLSILMLGNFLAIEWSTGLNHELSRPAAHIYRAMGIAALIYFVVMGIPYWLLWRTYKKAFVSFTSVQDELMVSGKSPGQQTRIYVAAGVAAFAILLAVGVFLLVRTK